MSKEQLNAILGGLTFEDLQQAMDSKKDMHVVGLKQKRAALVKEQTQAFEKFAVQIRAVDAEIAELTGRRVKSGRVRAPRDGRAGELSEAIRRALGAAPNKTLATKDIVAVLNQHGYTGDVNKAKNVVGTYLNRMLARGEVTKLSRGTFRLV